MKTFLKYTRLCDREEGSGDTWFYRVIVGGDWTRGVSDGLEEKWLRGRVGRYVYDAARGCFAKMALGGDVDSGCGNIKADVSFTLEHISGSCSNHRLDIYFSMI